MILHRVSLCTVCYNRTMLLTNFIKSAAKAIHGNICCELVVVDFNSDKPLDVIEAVKNNWPYWHTITRLNGEFSLGKGRNRALNDSQYDILAFLDADMLLPENFFDVIIPEIEKGKICFPLYKRYTSQEHKELSDGAGYGNVIFKRIDAERLLRFGKLWPEFTKWGGEDTPLARLASQQGIEIWREYIDGFYHQWHAKDSEFYRKDK